MKKIGILHISDVHIKASTISDIDKLVVKLINDIHNVQLEKNLHIDLICFAGDLINSGSMAQKGDMQLEIAEQHFIQPLLNALELKKDQFILVPGNHEINQDKIAKRTEMGLATITSLNDVNETVREMNSSYIERLQYFYDYMYSKYVTDAEPWNLGYSLNRCINGINIGIVGIDSAWRSTGAGQEERGKLLVGEPQVEYLLDKIKDSDLKICIMHHPLDWLSGLEMHNIERKLCQFDLVLRGHVHDLQDKQISTQRYKTIYNTSGKLYPIDNYYSGYSLIDINMDIHKCHIYSREYYAGQRETFDKALRINKEGEAEYSLIDYDEEKVVEFDLKLQLKDYFQRATEKYSMLRNIDTFSPEKVTDFFVEPIILEKSDYERTEMLNRETDKNRAKDKQKDRDKGIPLHNLIWDRSNILLIGKRESGKTTILQHFGIEHTEPESDKIPVYIDMLNLSKGQDRVLNACRVFIFNNLSDNISLNKEQVFNLLSNGKMLCLIDNLNISNVDHIKWIQTFTKVYPKNRFIFAVEEKFYQTYTIKEIPDLGVTCKTVYLQSFGKRQVREMITKWGANKDGFDANRMTQKIVAYCNNIHFSLTPFNIAVFMTIWDIDKNFVPVNEGKIMRTYLETVLDKFSAEGFQRSAYDFDIKQNFLGYLAYKMFQKDEYYFTVNEFNNLVDAYHEEKGFRKSDSKFDVIFFEKNILFQNVDLVFFSNTSIMEYCLAYYAIIDSEFYNYMTAKGNRKNFIHELSFYSGIVSDCSPLLNELYYEITETIIENIDLVDEVEKININTEFNTEKYSIQDTITQNRKTMNEIDDMDTSMTSEEKPPLEISKLNSLDEGESFLELLAIYGNAVKNAEILDAVQKKIHVDTYMMGMNFQFALIFREMSVYLTSKTKKDLPKELLEKHADLTEEEFIELKEMILDLVKICIPIGIQFFIADNIGTPKLEIVIKDLITDKQSQKFTRFMLSFLLCDMGNENIKSYLMKYIKDEDSTNILKLIMFKVAIYYSMRYFGNNLQIDDDLLDILTEVEVKLNSNQKYIANKGVIKKQLKRQHDANRIKFIDDTNKITESKIS